MKGIELCAECAYYNMKSHKCTRGCEIEPDSNKGEDVRFFADCPLPDVQPVKRGHWYHNTSKYISELDAYFIQACCSCCGKYSDRVDLYSQTMSNEMCSHCGADMRQEGESNG